MPFAKKILGLVGEWTAEVYFPHLRQGTEPVFVDLSRSPGIDSQAGRIDPSESIPGLHWHKRLQIRAQVGGEH